MVNTDGQISMGAVGASQASSTLRLEPKARVGRDEQVEVMYRGLSTQLPDTLIRDSGSLSAA